MSDRPGSTPDDSGDGPTTDLGFLSGAVEGEASAVGFVHVGDRFDDDLRYLTRFAGPDRDYAFAFVPDDDGDGGRAVLCAPRLFAEQARREFVDAAPDDGVERGVRTRDAGSPAGRRAAAALADLLGDGAGSGTLLVPRRIPHDAAVYLERAGYALRSTAAVGEARAVKTAAEIDRIRRVQGAAARGMERAESILAAADVAGDELRWEGEPLSTQRLRRAIDVALAERGVRGAGNTVIGSGPSAADLHFAGRAEIRPGDTVLIDVSPRGPRGYYGDLSRTFVVESEGGWERRAYVAVEAARKAALRHVEPGVEAATVHEEAAAELGAYGFSIDAREGEAGFTHGAGHGVGLSLHEGPILTGSDELRVGHAITIEPGVYDPERGGVRIEDLVVVTEGGYEILREYPISITPRVRDEN